MGVIYEPKGRAREYGQLAVNLYTSCPHGCAYPCYVPSALHKTRESWLQEACEPRKDILKRMAKELPKLAKASCADSVFLCFACDPYPNGADSTTTRKAIELLHEWEFGVTILTKNGVDARRDFDLLGSPDSFGVTLTFTDRNDSARWEPGATSPLERMGALASAHYKGIWTWASLEPVIDPSQTLELIRQSAEYVNEYKVGKWNHDARANAIDWAKFGHEAEVLLKSLGKDYYIKRDLREKMEC